MNRVFAFLIAAVASLSASAATVYQYVGPNYTSASSPYTTAQRVTGQFTTASPLAPNLPQASVLAQVTSYSFSDGVNSYASSDPNARVIEFKVATDAAGAISGWTVEIERVGERDVSAHCRKSREQHEHHRVRRPGPGQRQLQHCRNEPGRDRG